MEFILSYATGHGRIARAAWLFRLLVTGLLCLAFGMLAMAVVGEAGGTVLAALFVWCAVAVSVQRLHDIGNSGWTLLWLILPVLGPLWVLVQLLQRGAEGENRYGPDPLVRRDYLTVDISKQAN